VRDIYKQWRPAPLFRARRLECELIHDEDHMEGPFAKVTGCYANIAPRGKVKDLRIHRCKNPVFHTILSGKEVFNSIGLLDEATVLSLLQMQAPGVKDIYFTHGGCGFYGGVVQIAQTLVDYTLEKTGTAPKATLPSGGTLKDWILSQTNGSSHL